MWKTSMWDPGELLPVRLETTDFDRRMACLGRRQLPWFSFQLVCCMECGWDNIPDSNWIMPMSSLEMNNTAFLEAGSHFCEKFYCLGAYNVFSSGSEIPPCGSPHCCRTGIGLWNVNSPPPKSPPYSKSSCCSHHGINTPPLTDVAVVSQARDEIGLEINKWTVPWPGYFVLCVFVTDLPPELIWTGIGLHQSWH